MKDNNDKNEKRDTKSILEKRGDNNRVMGDGGGGKRLKMDWGEGIRDGYGGGGYKRR